MQPISDRRRRRPIRAISANRGTAEEARFSLLGRGSGFHDCPLCRDLGGQPEVAEATPATPPITGIRPESLPMLVRTGWLDDLVELVGRNATVHVMGRDMEAEPVEVISMETFLARLGCE